MYLPSSSVSKIDSFTTGCTKYIWAFNSSVPWIMTCRINRPSFPSSSSGPAISDRGVACAEAWAEGSAEGAAEAPSLLPPSSMSSSAGTISEGAGIFLMLFALTSVFSVRTLVLLVSDLASSSSALRRRGLRLRGGVFSFSFFGSGSTSSFEGLREDSREGSFDSSLFFRRRRFATPTSSSSSDLLSSFGGVFAGSSFGSSFAGAT
mmetsp:Transcript_10570/g.24900  ORF Transcript_10570/g.24900 Transcript_10570/m.24900 type:complete len:206 (-) Transcript_10570:425-1042(-)